jgi:6-pyruvoyltetrahydropterin/6-carboxytetrahydropterin synthase
MSFLVDVEHTFRAVQGLPSPVRAKRGLKPLGPGAGVDVTVKVGVEFEDWQLTDRGWFFDTDQAAEILEKHCAALAEDAWTEIFDFRPTFELVARELYRRLSAELAQLAYVEIRDATFGSTTRYAPSS